MFVSGKSNSLSIRLSTLSQVSGLGLESGFLNNLLYLNLIFVSASLNQRGARTSQWVVTLSPSILNEQNLLTAKSHRAHPRVRKSPTCSHLTYQPLPQGSKEQQRAGRWQQSDGIPLLCVTAGMWGRMMERQFQRSERVSSLPRQNCSAQRISHSSATQGSFYILCCFTFSQAMHQPCIITQSLKFFPCALRYCFLPQLGTYQFSFGSWRGYQLVLHFQSEQGGSLAFK